MPCGTSPAVTRRHSAIKNLRVDLRPSAVRDRISWTSMSAVSIPTPIARTSKRTIACGPFPGRRRGETAQTLLFNGADLLAQETEPLKETVELGTGVVRQWRSLRRADILQPGGRLAQVQSDAADTEADEDRLDVVDEPRLLADQSLMLAVRPPCVLFFERRDRRHGAMALLAARPAQKGAPGLAGFVTPALQQI